ncbi:hypothetical protein ACLGL1_09400 [Peptococcus simiae]|uniref:hypothetical protein n=1 Tax=Peptococcus simiae TaxID=1643805 RepID=UPI003980D6BA
MSKRKAVYNPEADKKWAQKNREHRNYLSSRTAARSFIRKRATAEDLAELKDLIALRESVYPQELNRDNKPIE